MIIKYKNGYEFYQDNQFILEAYPLDTSFFRGNCRMLNTFSQTSYAFKVMDGDAYLLVLCLEPYPTLVFGDYLLSKDAAEFMIENHLNISKVLCSKENYEALLSEFIQKMGGYMEIKLSMHLMYMDHLPALRIDAYDMVKQATQEDAQRIVQLTKSFSKEVKVDQTLSDEERYKKVFEQIDHYYYIEEDKKIVSIAKKVREEERICSISSVYTMPKYRNHGYARQIVSKMTMDILKQKRLHIYM